MEFQTRSVGERLVRFIYATPHWRDVGYVGADDKATTSDAASPGMCGCVPTDCYFTCPWATTCDHGSGQRQVS
jgi:hypothetical protein